MFGRVHSWVSHIERAAGQVQYDSDSCVRVQTYPKVYSTTSKITFLFCIFFYITIRMVPDPQDPFMSSNYTEPQQSYSDILPLTAFIFESLHEWPVQMYLTTQYVKNTDVLDPIMEYIGQSCGTFYRCSLDVK